MKKLILTGLAMIMIIVLTGHVFAADWNFYGSARVETFVTDTDNKGSRDSKNFSQTLQSNSRIGAQVKVSDELVGRFEYGTGVNVRQLYGEWNFGAGKFLVGQTYSPLNIFLSNQVYAEDENLDNYGGVYAGRQSMLQLTFGNFKIAAISPDTDTLGIANASTEVRIPKIEASYKLEMKEGYLVFAGGYGAYELQDPANLVDHDVDSYILAIGGEINFASAYFGGNFWTGQNTGPYNYACAADDMPLIVGTTLNDNEAFGYILVAGMKINKMFTCEIGYGYTEAELDMAGSMEDDVQSYYFNSTVTLANGVFFVPEIGVIDNKQDNTGAQEPEILYYGIKWQINF